MVSQLNGAHIAINSCILHRMLLNWHKRAANTVARMGDFNNFWVVSRLAYGLQGKADRMTKAESRESECIAPRPTKGGPSTNGAAFVFCPPFRPSVLSGWLQRNAFPRVRSDRRIAEAHRHILLSRPKREEILVVRALRVTGLTR